jgi:hypothetical protein
MGVRLTSQDEDLWFNRAWDGLTWAAHSRDVTIARVAAAQEVCVRKVQAPSLALVAVAANLVVTLPLAYFLNIWQDEAYTLHTTGSGFAYAFHQAIAFEQNAPFYFVFLTAWRHFGESIFFLRLPSVLFVAIAIALVPELVRRYVPAADAALVTLVVAWNPFVIWTALEMRVYALVILLSALLLLTFYDAFLAERPSKGAAIAYAAVCVLGLYTQYYLGFLIAAQAATVLLYRRQAFARFALCAAAGALGFAPMLAIVPGQVQNFKNAFTPPTLVQAFAVLGLILARYALPLIVPHAKYIYAALAAGAGAAALAAWRKLAPFGEATILVMTGLAFVGFALGTYALGVHILDRHAASLYLPSLLSIFAVLTFLRASVRRRASLIWCVVALAASMAALVKTYAPLAKPGDWVRATAYLQANESPNEPVAVFEAENALPFAYYYHGLNRITAVPRSVDFNGYNISRFVIADPAELETVLPRAARIWLVTAGECRSANVRFGCDELEGFVGRHFRVESDARFYGARIRLLYRAQAGGGFGGDLRGAKFAPPAGVRRLKGVILGGLVNFDYVARPLLRRV